MRLWLWIAVPRLQIVKLSYICYEVDGTKYETTIRYLGILKLFFDYEWIRGAWDFQLAWKYPNGDTEDQRYNVLI